MSASNPIDVGVGVVQGVVLEAPQVRARAEKARRRRRTRPGGSPSWCARLRHPSGSGGRRAGNARRRPASDRRGIPCLDDIEHGRWGSSGASSPRDAHHRDVTAGALHPFPGERWPRGRGGASPARPGRRAAGKPIGRDAGGHRCDGSPEHAKPRTSPRRAPGAPDCVSLPTPPPAAMTPPSEPHLPRSAPAPSSARFEGLNMDELVRVSVIHFFDVRRRETLCGLRGFEHRSTKHARGVTCPACVGLLHPRLEPEAIPNPDQGGGSSASA